MIKTVKYVRKPVIVDAVQVSEDNFFDMASWCTGEVRHQNTNEPLVASDGEISAKDLYIWIRVSQPKSARQTKAYISDWILYTETGYKIYTNRAFQAAFNPIGEEVKA